jgi:hypothetical protein
MQSVRPGLSRQFAQYFKHAKRRRVTMTAELDAATVESVLAVDLPAHAITARRSYANGLDLLSFLAAGFIAHWQ